MLLSELIANIDDVEIINEKDVEVTNVVLDSREVEEGSIFVVVKGLHVNGAEFIPDAIAKGAKAIVVDSNTYTKDLDVAVIKTNNVRKVGCILTSKFRFYDIERMVAVTGTNGKTSTVNFCKQLWGALACEAASLGTIGVRSKEINENRSLTVMEPREFYADLENLTKNNVTHLAFEASSQGLDQYRLENIEVKAAAFTNLTQDHLDYHGDMEEYFNAKVRLFSEVVEDGAVAVINLDDVWGDRFLEIAKKRGLKVLTYGEKMSDIRLLERHMLPHGQEVKIEVLGKIYELDIPLIGEFQIYNILCALGLVISEKLDDRKFIDKAVAAIENLQSVRGRLELAVTLKNKAAIYVDYAHTPAAVESVLKSIRPHVPEGSNLHCIVGCGGDRDRTKRPLMGKAAVDLADIAIITDDNPRTEDPTFIRSEVMAGAVGAQEIFPRDNAIKQAVANLGEGDILVIAGKGHEDYQILGTEKIHFSDVEESQKAVKELEG